MAHTNTRIYIDTNSTPNKGVEIADVQAVLGLSNNDIGALISNGATTGRIRKWAKYKPTRKQGLNPANWWEGDGKQIYGSSTSKPNYGFSFVDFTSLATLKSAMDANNIGWEYEAPRGITVQSGEWFRLLDFNGYYHGSTTPFERVGLEGEQYPTIDDVDIFVYVDFVRTDGSLGAGDFGLFNDWYFGIAIYGGGSGQLVGKGTSSVAFGQQSDAARKVRMTLPVRAVGTCYLYPFFSYNQIAWSDAATEPAGNQRYIPLPIGRETITVISGGLLSGLEFAFGTGGSITYLATNGRLTISFPALSVTNTGNSQKQISLGNIYYQPYIQKISDSSSHWAGEITTMGLSGPLQIASGATDTVFASGTSKVLNNPTGTGTIAGYAQTMTLYDFIAQAGGSFANDYAASVLMWYYDPDHANYLPIDATFDPNA